MASNTNYKINVNKPIYDVDNDYDTHTDNQNQNNSPSHLLLNKNVSFVNNTPINININNHIHNNSNVSNIYTKPIKKSSNIHYSNHNSSINSLIENSQRSFAHPLIILVSSHEIGKKNNSNNNSNNNINEEKSIKSSDSFCGISVVAKEINNYSVSKFNLSKNQLSVDLNISHASNIGNSSIVNDSRNRLNLNSSNNKYTYDKQIHGFINSIDKLNHKIEEDNGKNIKGATNINQSNQSNQSMYNNSNCIKETLKETLKDKNIKEKGNITKPGPPCSSCCIIM